MGMKPSDYDTLPGCFNCHRMEDNTGIVSLWRSIRPELWVDDPEDADPAKGRLHTKQDLREWIDIQCEAYYQLWKSKEK